VTRGREDRGVHPGGTGGAPAHGVADGPGGVPGDPGLSTDGFVGFRPTWEDAPLEPEIDVREYLRLLWSGRWIVLAVAAVVVALGLGWALTRPKVYQATCTISIDSHPPQIIKNQINLSPTWWELERYINEQERVIRSRTLAQRVVDRLGLANHPEFGDVEDPAGLLLSMIEVEPLKAGDVSSNVLDISMRGGDPERITEWLNVYVHEYIAFNIEDNLKRMRQIYEVIQSKLEPLREQLSASERQLTRFKERQDSLLFADQDKNVITEQVNALTSEYAKTKTERIRLETKINALKEIQKSGGSLAAFPEVAGDPTIQSLQDQRRRLEVELDEKLKTYKGGHPVIKDLRGRIDGVRRQIREQIDGIIARLRTDYEIKKKREASLYANIQKLKQQSIELSKQTMEYEKLKREYEQNKAFYEEMLARSKEADISGTVAMNNIRIIDEARRPDFPVSPNVPRTVLLSLVLGLMLGVGVVFGLDYLDQSLRNPEAVERHTGLEVFAVVPAYDDEPGPAIREVYQSLRTALLFASRGERSQILMVTSAGPGEGKSTTSRRLAETFAATGSRVLLIDADLRKPSVHRFLEADRTIGLTSVVLGEVSLEEAVVPVREAGPLDVLPSGPLPPNPPEMFGKESFLRLLEHARETYDWVILDSPPVISVTDPVVCSPLADMVLLVVQYGRLDRKVIVGALRQLARAGARVVGAVLNRVDLEREHHYADGYYAGYYHYASGAAAVEGPAER